jgi:ABC-type uncharacterized transport system involved in gliding motility auxiliary subunit
MMIKQLIQKRLWQLLFWIGIVIFIAGLTSGLVSEKWGVISLGLVILGLILSGLSIMVKIQRTGFWKFRSIQVSANALIATFAVFAILGLINFLGVRYHLRVDLTENQLFTLSPQSEELVQSLSNPAKVWIFAKDQNSQDLELLRDYHRQNPKFQFEYIDPEARPRLAEKFGVRDLGQVYLEYGDKRKLVQTIGEGQRLSEVSLTNRLQQILSQTIVKVYFLQGHGEHPLSNTNCFQQEDPSKTVVCKGSISQAIQELTAKNLVTAPLNLSETQKVPDDASVVVIAGSQRALLPGEVQALANYLHLGGNLLLMIDPNTDPKIDSLLQEWGVTLDNRLAIDTSGESLGLGPAAPLVTEYGKHPITKDFGNGISFYRLARPIITQKVANVESTPLLFTKPYPKSWAETDQQSEKLEFHPGDLKGPLVLGVALTKKLITPINPNPTPSITPSPLPSISKQAQPTPSITPLPLPSIPKQVKLPSLPTPSALPNISKQIKASPLPLPAISKQTKLSPSTTPSPLPSISQQANPSQSPSPSTTQAKTKESRLVVFGNSDFATDGLFQQQLNGDVFLNSVTWLSQQDQTPLSIRPKEPNNRRINLSTLQANVLTISSVLILPFIGLIAAFVVWWIRR